MRIDVITLFPEILAGALGSTILGRAARGGAVSYHLHQLRDYATDKHRTVDERPYGGGPGMLLKCEPIAAAIESVQRMAPERGRVIYLSPGGRLLKQPVVRELTNHPRLILLTGHYEGIDQRVIDHLVDEELSIGDYVLSNGATAALVLIDAVVRLLPGVLGNEDSAQLDSFQDGILEGPQYTRPAEFRGWHVPEVLLRGHHGEIAQWRRERGLEKTQRLRPELLPPRSS